MGRRELSEKEYKLLSLRTIDPCQKGNCTPSPDDSGEACSCKKRLDWEMHRRALQESGLLEIAEAIDKVELAALQISKDFNAIDRLWGRIANNHRGAKRARLALIQKVDGLEELVDDAFYLNVPAEVLEKYE